MLFGATATAGIVWGLPGWPTAVVAWACVPAAHLIKHILGWSDTLHPNTYASILYLAAFSLVVAAVGVGSGMLIRRLTIGAMRRDS